MMKKIHLLLLLLCIFMLSGCSEKTVKSMNPDERQKLVQMFADEYKGNFSYVKKLDVYLLAEDNEYYDSEKLRVQLKNEYTYYSENGIFEIMCYYDKDAKKWRYQGYYTLELDKKLDILGEWTFEILPGYFSNVSHYVGYMDIKEIKDNQMLIGMRVDTGTGERTVADQWVKLSILDVTKFEPEHFYTHSFITVPPPADKKGTSLKHSLNIYYDDIAVRSTDYYEVKKIYRLSSHAGNNTVTLNIHK